VHSIAAGQSLVIRAPAGIRVEAGERVTAGFDASAVHWFDAQTTRRIDD
jgi:sn-glycerol 3-phosphate transport system ATP-binding protein